MFEIGASPAYCEGKRLKGEQNMREYEVLVRTIRPCPGDAHDRETFLEVEADSPEAYVLENAPYPILDSVENLNGETIITTGDGEGNFIKYTFTK